MSKIIDSEEIRSPTARMFGAMLDRHPEIRQYELQERMGFSQRSNIITQLRKGRTRVPIDRIAELCSILNEDYKPFLLVALKEYHPEVLEALQKVRGEIINDEENAVVGLYREVRREWIDNYTRDAVSAYENECAEKGREPAKWKLHELGRQDTKFTENKAKLKKLKSSLMDCIEIP